MKTVFKFITLLALLVSCDNKNKNEYSKLEKKYMNLSNSSERISKKMDSIENNYLKPFTIYEDAVLNEVNRSPDTIISIYKRFIKEYPNSFWSHEAKNRIYNVEIRRKLWSEEKGWEMLKVKPKNIEIISCPGC